MCGYKEEELYSYTIAEDLITLCNIAREKGLLAIEEQIEKLKSKEPFLQFACTFALNLCQTSFGTPERIRLLLLHYAASERFIKKETVRKRPDYEMIAEVIPEIFSGENVECLKELIASFLGKDLRNRLLQEGFLKGKDKMLKEEILQQIKEKDATIQLLLRQLNNTEVTSVLIGSNGAVGKRIFENLSQRLAYFIYEDMKLFQGTKEELLINERHVLEVYHVLKRKNKVLLENE